MWWKDHDFPCRHIQYCIIKILCKVRIRVHVFFILAIPPLKNFNTFYYYARLWIISKRGLYKNEVAHLINGRWNLIPLTPTFVSAGTTAVWLGRRRSSSCSPAKRPASWSGTVSRTTANTPSPSSECVLKVHLFCLKGCNINLLIQHYLSITWCTAVYKRIQM